MENIIQLVVGPLKDKRIIFFWTKNVSYFKSKADELFVSHLPSFLKNKDTFKKIYGVKGIMELNFMISRTSKIHLKNYTW